MYNDDSFATGYMVGAGENNRNNDGFFGGDWGWIVILALLFGWGGNGFGGGFGGGCGSHCATQADLAAGFNNSAVLSSLNDIKLSQQQAINYNNQGFAGLNAALNAGFAGVDNAVCTLGYNVQNGINGISNQIASCCCDLGRSLDKVAYENQAQTCALQNAMCTNTRDIIDSQREGTTAILNFLTNEKIESLRAENTSLKAKLSNEHQTADIVSALAPKAPIPAYPVFPATSFAYPTGVAFGCGANNNCGCGCGCGF